jgi:hypothetical protein
LYSVKKVLQSSRHELLNFQQILLGAENPAAAINICEERNRARGEN